MAGRDARAVTPRDSRIDPEGNLLDDHSILNITYRSSEVFQLDGTQLENAGQLPDPGAADEAGIAARVIDLLDTALANGVIVPPAGIDVLTIADDCDHGDNIVVSLRSKGPLPSLWVTTGWQSALNLTETADRWDSASEANRIRCALSALVSMLNEPLAAASVTADAQVAGVTSEELDDAVINAATETASRANNGGVDAQISYLIQQYGEAAVRRLMRDIAQERAA